MSLLTPIEESALEMMLRHKLGSGVGTSALLKVLKCVDESFEEVPTPEVEPTTPVATVEVTESSP
jgi:hypothetical protein